MIKRLLAIVPNTNNIKKKEKRSPVKKSIVNLQRDLLKLKQKKN